MLTKRQFLSASAGVLGCCAVDGRLATARDNASEADTGESMPMDAFGCGVTSERFEEITSRGWLRGLGEGALADDRFRFLERSGDALFDQMLGRVLLQMADAFEVYPAFRYYDDANGKNAMATHRCLPSYAGKRCDGTVIFGARLALQLRPAPAGDAAILAICAHEFGHILAFERRLDIALASRKLPRRPNFELHADFMAGVFLRKYIRDFPGVDVTGVARAWMQMGSTDFTDPHWHGTTEMRSESIQAGFSLEDRTPRLSMREAHDEGVRYLDLRRWG